MLEKNTSHQLSSSHEDRLLISIYRNRLKRCGVTPKQIKHLLKVKSLSELKEIAKQLKPQITGAYSNPELIQKQDSQDWLLNLDTRACRVRSKRPSGKNRHLCCSRKRSKVDKALLASEFISRDFDPLRHLGYLDDHAKDTLIEKTIEHHLTNSHGSKERSETH
ncbi:hypothetical protein MACH09_47060 [Vibrio sp. MACH09]|uniref:hypothetical protein n=1 Tax=Vibrio sp. MACH09 TaxID=3025122 RepID=UPI0027936471|nr:hypothetical protein [Vibrio sp. MACH09]GLO64198.1 hypothetical protein MACH09_47060 [Vibrio sp. MACH09]